jgi:hypothetical protein
VFEQQLSAYGPDDSRKERERELRHKKNKTGRGGFRPFMSHFSDLSDT